MTFPTEKALQARYRATAFADEALLYHHAGSQGWLVEHHAKQVMAEIGRLRIFLDEAEAEISARFPKEAAA